MLPGRSGHYISLQMVSNFLARIIERALHALIADYRLPCPAHSLRDKVPRRLGCNILLLHAAILSIAARYNILQQNNRDEMNVAEGFDINLHTAQIDRQKTRIQRSFGLMRINWYVEGTA